MPLAIFGLATLNSVRAETKTEILSKISELSGGDIVLQEIATEIAISESKLDSLAKNPESSATGIFQFLKSTWRKNCKGDRLNYEDNIACGVSILVQNGFAHWNASKYLWYPKLSPQAKLRVSGTISETTIVKVLSFAGGRVNIDKQGNIIDGNGNIFIEGDIPFVELTL